MLGSFRISLKSCARRPAERLCCVAKTSTESVLSMSLCCRDSRISSSDVTGTEFVVQKVRKGIGEDQLRARPRPLSQSVARIDSE
eukprot:274962-Rhodomonas_salina.1